MLTVEYQREARGEKLLFSGSLDEKARLPSLALDGAKKVVINLSQLKRMNSSGVSTWIIWIQSLPGDCVFLFEHCPAFFVELLTSVEGMLPNRAEMESFQVPYFNPVVEEVEYIEFRNGTHFDERSLYLPIQIKSEGNRALLEIDVRPEQYFHFLTRFYPKIKLPSWKEE